MASKSAFSRSLHDCKTGVCVREGVAEGAAEGVFDAAFLAKLWKMLPNTLDDPGLDRGGCSVCARTDGDACRVATGALVCVASAALFCCSANRRACSAASRSSQYCGGSESTGNIVAVVSCVMRQSGFEVWCVAILARRCVEYWVLIIKVQRCRVADYDFFR